MNKKPKPGMNWKNVPAPKPSPFPPQIHSTLEYQPLCSSAERNPDKIPAGRSILGFKGQWKELGAIFEFLVGFLGGIKVDSWGGIQEFLGINSWE